MSNRTATEPSVHRKEAAGRVRVSAVRAANPILAPEPALAAISVERVTSIADVHTAEWDRLAGANVLQSHGLLRTIEETNLTRHAARYFLARRNMELVGAIVCHIEEDSNSEGAIPIGGHRLDRMMLGRLARFGRTSRVVSLPCLMCGTQMGTCDPLMLREGTSAAESARIAEALVDAIERSAERKGWTVCFRQVRQNGSPLAAALMKREYLRGAELPTACLEIDPVWRSFEDYRQHLKRSHPHTAKTILGEMNRKTKAGLRIEQIDDPGLHRETLHRLMEAHNLSHNGKPWPFRAEFFERLKERLGDRASIYGAKMDGQWVGVAVNVQGGTEVVGSMIGIDREAKRGAAVYFNLAYNHLIEQSVCARRQRIYYGPLLWDLKARRGCRPVEADFYLKGNSRLQQMILRPLVHVRTKTHDAISAPLRCHEGNRKTT
jgi:predicted N-acyltransferase